MLNLHPSNSNLFWKLILQAHKGGSNIRKMQAMRFLLIQLLLQIPLKHEEVCETATELLICCKEAFGNVIDLDVESDNEENVRPAFMDVLIDALLSLLPQSSGPVRVAVEQVSFFSKDRIALRFPTHILMFLKPKVFISLLSCRCSGVSVTA